MINKFMIFIVKKDQNFWKNIFKFFLYQFQKVLRIVLNSLRFDEHNEVKKWLRSDLEE